jgi:hypothetical protein
VRASDLFGAVFLAHSDCPPGHTTARGTTCAVDNCQRRVHAHGQSRLPNERRGVLPDGGAVPKPAERATWLKLACEWLALNSTEACRY